MNKKHFYKENNAIIELNDKEAELYSKIKKTLRKLNAACNKMEFEAPIKTSIECFSIYKSHFDLEDITEIIKYEKTALCLKEIEKIFTQRLKNLNEDLATMKSFLDFLNYE